MSVVETQTRKKQKKKWKACKTTELKNNQKEIKMKLCFVIFLLSLFIVLCVKSAVVCFFAEIGQGPIHPKALINISMRNTLQIEKNICFFETTLLNVILHSLKIFSFPIEILLGSHIDRSFSSTIYLRSMKQPSYEGVLISKIYICLFGEYQYFLLRSLLLYLSHRIFNPIFITWSIDKMIEYLAQSAGALEYTDCFSAEG